MLEPIHPDRCQRAVGAPASAGKRGADLLPRILQAGLPHDEVPPVFAAGPNADPDSAARPREMPGTAMTSLNDDLTIHRAVYGDAHRRGDALATAGAAARLRAHITDLDAAELTVVRASRQRFGQAIREARSRRRAAPVVPMQALAIPLSPPRRSPVALAALFALLALVLAAVVGGPLLVEQTEGGAGGGAPVDVVDPVVQPVTLSRGRVILAVAAGVPAVVEEPQVTASPDPIAVVATPGPAAPANGADAPAGSSPPGHRGGPGPGVPGDRRGGGAPQPPPTAPRTPAA